MANVIGKEKAKGKIYNVQDTQSVTFEGLAQLCAQAMGTDYKGDVKKVPIKLYDKKMFDFGEKKAFPMVTEIQLPSISEKLKYTVSITPLFFLL